MLALAVRHVDAGDIHTRKHQIPQSLFGLRGGSDRSDYLCSAHRLAGAMGAQASLPPLSADAIIFLAKGQAGMPALPGVTIQPAPDSPLHPVLFRAPGCS